MEAIVLFFMLLILRWLVRESKRPKYRCLFKPHFRNDLILPREKMGRAPKGPMAR